MLAAEIKHGETAGASFCALLHAMPGGIQNLVAAGVQWRNDLLAASSERSRNR